MLILLPALLASGILAATEIQHGPENASRRLSANVFSMTLNHSSAFESAQAKGFPLGEIVAANQSPFRDVQPWRSLIVSDGARKLLLTWAPEFNSDIGVPVATSPGRIHNWKTESGSRPIRWDDCRTLQQDGGRAFHRQCQDSGSGGRHHRRRTSYRHMDSMTALLILTLAPAAAAVSLRLGQTGLKRLRHNADPPAAAILAASAACALTGMILTWPETGGDLFSIGLTAATAFLCSMLAAAALIDWKSAWAPTELILPICLLAGVCAAAAAGLSRMPFGFNLVSGGALFAAAWGLWAVQNSLRLPILPPADAVALALPVILLSSAEIQAAFYLALSAALILVWLSQRRGHSSILLPDRRIPLLAAAFPALIFCMWAEALLFQSGIGPVSAA